MSFQDIIKNSILETMENNTLSTASICITLGIAILFCIYIYAVYYLSQKKSFYNKQFNIVLGVLPIITAGIILAMQSNLVISLGMVGALSIVRFRTAIKDSRDTIYIFWAIVVGICCGAGDYLVAAAGSAVVFLLLLLFGRIRTDNRALLILRTARVNESRVESLFFQYYNRKAVLRAKNTTDESTEYIYELNGKYLRKPAGEKAAGRSITDAVYEIGGIEYFNIVMQNDEISG